MAEHRITIQIDENGKVSASTSGIKGELCLKELENLLGDLDELSSIKKTDEYYQQETNTNNQAQQNKNL